MSLTVMAARLVVIDVGSDTLNGWDSSSCHVLLMSLASSRGLVSAWKLVGTFHI